MSDNILVHFQDLYCPSLRHQTSVIQEQVDAGLYVTKRFAYFLQKLMLARKPAVQEMIKLTEHEKEKIDRAKMDKMTHHLDAYLKTQNTYSQMLNDEYKFIQAVLESVAEPLLKWHKEAEKTRDSIVKKEAALHKNYRDALAKINSARESALKSWNALQSTRKDILRAQQAVRDGKNNAAKDLKNAETKLKKDKTKVEAEFRKLEIMVENGNSYQEVYWSSDLPKIVEEWEKLEVDRLHRFGAHFALYSRLQQQAVNPIQMASVVFDEAFQNLNGASEMREFVQGNVRIAGLPSAPSTLLPKLPCSSVDIGSTNPAAESRLNELLDMDVNQAILTQTPEQEDSRQSMVSTNSLKISMNSPSAQPSHQQILEDQCENQASVNSPPPSDYTSDYRFSVCVPPPEARTISSHPPSPSPIREEGTLPQKIPLYQGKVPFRFFRAMFDFESTDDEDLPFMEGDIVALIEEPAGGIEMSPEGAWWIGTILLPDGTYSRSGTFPSNYVAPHSMN